jgi:hypothetical protein
MISNTVWNEVNKLPFPIHDICYPDKDKIPNNAVMDHLENKRRILSPIPIGYVNTDKVHKFVYDDFSEEVKIFLKQEQKVWFAYPSSNITMKVNYLKLYIRNKLNNKEDDS